mmetsp:Transcript_9429/g.34612  ORF Transcript_9429/g.34612 Transcript_9429/m.34612 type:complete len:519 (-) Transcript_9429:47-1603(-)
MIRDKSIYHRSQREVEGVDDDGKDSTKVRLLGLISVTKWEEGGWLLPSSHFFTQCVAEAWGTALIVLYGCGVVCAAVFTGAQQGIWQVAAVWGLTVSLAIFTTAHISGAHLNPAITLAFAISRGFETRKSIWYVIFQFLGAVFGAMMNYGIYYNAIRNFEDMNEIQRGSRASVLSAQAFGEYFPNPGLTQQPFLTDEENEGLLLTNDVVNSWQCMLTEAWGTFMLSATIFAVTEKKNNKVGDGHLLAPFLIGALIAINLSCYAPLTQAGWNPARDFGPRLVSLWFGWGHTAIPGPRSGFWAYIVGPLIGAPLGGLFHDYILMGGLWVNQSEEELYEVPEDKPLPNKYAKRALDVTASQGAPEETGAWAPNRPRVLFISRSNADASLAAEAIARHHRPDLDVASCGTEPVKRVDAQVLQALHERKIPVDDVRPCSIVDVGGIEAWDFIVRTERSVTEYGDRAIQTWDLGGTNVEHLNIGELVQRVRGLDPRTVSVDADSASSTKEDVVPAAKVSANNST